MAISPRVQTTTVAMYSGTVTASWVRPNPTPTRSWPTAMTREWSRRVSQFSTRGWTQTMTIPFTATVIPYAAGLKPACCIASGSPAVAWL